MARVPWTFAGYNWPVNPEKDSDWVGSFVNTEHHPIESQKSSFQYTARRSSRRRISGWLFGPYAAAQLTQMQAWYNSRQTATLVDHTGQARACFLFSLELEHVQAVSEWQQGRNVYKYNAEFVEA
jgi:hypothetical protein